MDYLCGERGFPYCFPTRGLCLPGLWAHCQVSNLEDPQKFEKCERPCLGRNPEGSSGLWLENFRGYCGSPQCSFSRCRSNWMGVSISARRRNFPRTHLRLWFTAMIYGYDLRLWFTVMICCNWPFIRKQHMIWTVHRFLGIWARLLQRSPKIANYKKDKQFKFNYTWKAIQKCRNH